MEVDGTNRLALQARAKELARIFHSRISLRRALPLFVGVLALLPVSVVSRLFPLITGAISQPCSTVSLSTRINLWSHPLWQRSLQTQGFGFSAPWIVIDPEERRDQ